MNHFIKILGAISIVLSVTLSACKKEDKEEEIELPEVTTLDATYIRRTSVELYGSRSIIDTASHITYGFCWSTKSLPTIEIGTQTWMAENLRTTQYSDATAIPLITDGDEWKHLTTPGYCWYDNNEEIYKNIYGAYYNWHTVNTGKLCPSGWHVPSDEEWKILEIYLGMSPKDADLPYHGRGTSEDLKIKETGTGNWEPDKNINGTNESGFTGLPGGFRWGYGNSQLSAEGIISFWWTSSEGVENVWAYGRMGVCFITIDQGLIQNFCLSKGKTR